MGSLEKTTCFCSFSFCFSASKHGRFLQRFGVFQLAGPPFLEAAAVASPRKAIRKKGAEIAHSSAEFFHHGTEVDSWTQGRDGR